MPEINWAGRFDVNDRKSIKNEREMDIILSKNPILKSKVNFLGEVHNTKN